MDNVFQLILYGSRCEYLGCPDSRINQYHTKNRISTNIHDHFSNFTVFIKKLMCPDTCRDSNCIAKRNYANMINILGYDISSVVMKYLGPV